jgi:hypothetical protein
MHLRAERMADADNDAVVGKGSVVTLSRPRGYFDLQRDASALTTSRHCPACHWLLLVSAAPKSNLPKCLPLPAQASMAK